MKQVLLYVLVVSSARRQPLDMTLSFSHNFDWLNWHDSNFKAEEKSIKKLNIFLCIFTLALNINNDFCTNILYISYNFKLIWSL